ncbi:GumC family protein [Dyadobacter psychrotolerans]|uniref:non-specific protein-tyrosine kinase n=1 Tax=Dyadobacter psychrotolerans TaxID=2541721 RepID=A0A4R5DL69_9BACT|nr:tyrosine-protein kinase [Dyadobacter psychrotolerans]TDE11605.1 polysaccharide biosynthesis tyrosine autokinase [Dyadobacter psychrotolerans]
MASYLENITSIESGSTVNHTLTQTIRRLISLWPWLILSQIFSLLASFIYLRYSTPRYEITSTILVKDDTKGTDLGEAAILENLGLAPGKSNVDNEVEILKSRTLIESVVSDLQLYISYFVSGNIKTAEIYDKSPVILHLIDPKSDQIKRTEVTYKITVKANDQFTLTDKVHTWNQSFGDTFLLPTGEATLRKTIYKPDPENTYSIKISGFESTVSEYSRRLSISATNKQVSIISLRLTDILPRKGEALLKKLTENYLSTSITDKNRIADSTIAFIDQNLHLVSLELKDIEEKIESFRRKNHITDMAEQSRLLLANSSLYDKEKLQVNLELDMISSLQAFIKKNPNGIIPSSIVLQSSDFTLLTDKYNTVQLSRDKAGYNFTGQHPAMQNLDLQLKRIREEIIQHIESKRNELQINKLSLEKKAVTFQTEMDHIPSRQRTFIDQTRQQQIKQELYIFLLKKRIETSISKSSTIASGRIIDVAKAEEIPVSPNRQLTFLLALLSGLGIPLAISGLLEIFTTRVTDKQELIKFTDVPLIAEIAHKRLPGVQVFEQKGRDPISEQFRTFRTNIQFLSAAEDQKVILITSGMSGEGKTFVAINLCSALGLAEKKVILLDFDLRQPKIASYLNITGKGITDFLISTTKEDNLIRPSGLSIAFDVITAGTIPPNPAELILSDKVKSLILKLKETYDYIILDSPPIGLVTDARLLSQYADISLYVIRQNFTFKHQLEDLKGISKSGLLPKLHLVLNDVKPAPGNGYNYGYGKD